MSCPHNFNGVCSDCADRDRADELARLRAENSRALSAVKAERDRLRAVLATTQENVRVLVQSVGERYITQAAVCTILSAQRARAGLDRCDCADPVVPEGQGGCQRCGRPTP